MKFNIPIIGAVYELKKDMKILIPSEYSRPRNHNFHKYAAEKFPQFYTKNSIYHHYDGGLVLDISAGCVFRYSKRNVISLSRKINKDRPYDHAAINIAMSDECLQKLEVELVE